MTDPSNDIPAPDSRVLVVPDTGTIDPCARCGAPTHDVYCGIFLCRGHYYFAYDTVQATIQAVTTGTAVPSMPPAPASWLTEDGTDYACAHPTCAHGLRSHDLDGTRCRLCALAGDRHGFTRVLPPACPVEFCSAAWARDFVQQHPVCLKSQQGASQ
jgi:hypothetical protein